MDGDVGQLNYLRQADDRLVIIQYIQDYQILLTN